MINIILFRYRSSIVWLCIHDIHSRVSLTDDLGLDRRFHVEPTPVLVQNSATSTFSLGWVKQKYQDHDDHQEEGSGRGKREYDLIKDYLIWTPSGKIKTYLKKNKVN